MDNQRTKNATRNMVFGSMLKLYQLVLPFVMRTAIIYFLGMQYLGLNSLFTSVLQVLNLAELGVGSAMVYSMYKPIIDGDKDKICALLKLYRIYYRVIGIVIAVLGVVVIPFLPKLISGTIPSDMNLYILYLLNLSATVMSYWLFAYKNSLLVAHQRTDVTSKVTLLTNTVQYVLQLAVLFVFKNYYLYLIISLLSQILTNIITAIAADRMYPEYRPAGDLDKGEVRTINRRVRDLFTAKFGSVVVNSVDSIVISAFLGLTALAIYQNYFYILTAITGFITIIFNSVTAGIGNSLVVETLDKNYNDFKKFTFIIFWILSVASCCFLCLYQPFMTIWVGSDNLLDDFCVVLFVIYFIVCELSMVWATYKDAAGMWHEDRFRPLIGASVNLILNVILVQYIGIYGILLSTIISYVLITMPWLIHNLFTRLFKRSARSYLLKLAAYAGACIISCVCCVLVCNLITVNNILIVFVKLIICVLIADAVLILFFRKTNEYKETKALVMKIIKRG